MSTDELLTDFLSIFNKPVLLELLSYFIIDDPFEDGFASVLIFFQYLGWNELFYPIGWALVDPVPTPKLLARLACLIWIL